jgi:hypothetical protein
MTGLCFGILIGRATQTFWYPVLVRRCLNRATELASWWLIRPLFTMTLVFASCAYLGQRLLVHHWVPWAAAVFLSVILVPGIMLEWGLPADVQASVRARVAELGRRIGRGQSGSSAR